MQQRKHNLKRFLCLCTSSFSILKHRNHRELPAACLGQREVHLTFSKHSFILIWEGKRRKKLCSGLVGKDVESRIITVLQGAQVMVPAFVHMKFLNCALRPHPKTLICSPHGNKECQDSVAPSCPLAYAQKDQVGHSCSPTRAEEDTSKPQPHSKAQDYTWSSNYTYGDESVSVIQVVVLSTEGFSFLPLSLQPHLPVMPEKEAQKKNGLKVNSITWTMPLPSVCARERDKGCPVAATQGSCFL